MSFSNPASASQCRRWYDAPSYGTVRQAFRLLGQLPDTLAWQILGVFERWRKAQRSKEIHALCGLKMLGAERVLDLHRLYGPQARHDQKAVVHHAAKALLYFPVAQRLDYGVQLLRICKEVDQILLLEQALGQQETHHALVTTIQLFADTGLEPAERYVHRLKRRHNDEDSPRGALPTHQSAVPGAAGNSNPLASPSVQLHTIHHPVPSSRTIR